MPLKYLYGVMLSALCFSFLAVWSLSLDKVLPTVKESFSENDMCLMHLITSKSEGKKL